MAEMLTVVLAVLAHRKRTARQPSWHCVECKRRCTTDERDE